MLTITKPGENRVDLALSGGVDADEMRRALDELLEVSQEVRGGRMLYTIDDFEWPSLGALSVEMGRLPSLFGLISRFDRVAVLCDTAWIRKAAEIEGAVIPGMAVRSFGREEREAAEAWLAGD
ncbi:MAG: STAS/SEC14 domain-containing protein [Pseudomonadota bacterium]